MPRAVVNVLPDSLLAIEQRFRVARESPPDLPGAFEEAWRTALDDDADAPRWAPLRATARRLLTALDTAARAGELPYHDRHHFAEATLGMGWLCGLSRRGGQIGAAAAAEGTVAMLGHDLGHDGGFETDGRLETKAALAVAAHAAVAGVDSATQARLADIVRATCPAQVENNAKRATRTTANEADRMHMLANEADVFSSMMPHLGRDLGLKLVEEWRAAGHPDPEAVASYAGRVAFLQRYARFSPAATQLGLKAACDAQLAAARSLDIASLDGMDRVSADCVFDAALRSI